MVDHERGQRLGGGLDLPVEERGSVVGQRLAELQVLLDQRPVMRSNKIHIRYVCSRIMESILAGFNTSYVLYTLVDTSCRP